MSGMIFFVALGIGAALAAPVSIKTIEIKNQKSFEEAKELIQQQSEPVLSILDVQRENEASDLASELFETIREKEPKVPFTSIEIAASTDIKVTRSQLLFELEGRALTRIAPIRFTLTMVRVGGLFGGIFYVTQNVAGPGMATLIAATAASMSYRLMAENHVIMKWLKNFSFPGVDHLLRATARLHRSQSRPDIADWIESIPQKTVPVPLNFITSGIKVFALNYGYMLVLHAVASLFGSESFYVQSGTIDTAKFWSMLSVAGMATKAELAGFIANSSIYSDLSHSAAHSVTRQEEMDKGTQRVAAAMSISLVISAVQSVLSTVAQVSGPESRWVLDSIFYAGAATIIAHMGAKWWRRHHSVSCEANLKKSP